MVRREPTPASPPPLVLLDAAERGYGPVGPYPRSRNDSRGPTAHRAEDLRLERFYADSCHTAYANASAFRSSAVSLMFDEVSHEEW